MTEENESKELEIVTFDMVVENSDAKSSQQVQN
jgi:hypothetical protein